MPTRKVDKTTPKVASTKTGHFCRLRSSKLTVREPAKRRKESIPSKTQRVKVERNEKPFRPVLRDRTAHEKQPERQEERDERDADGGGKFDKALIDVTKERGDSQNNGDGLENTHRISLRRS